MNLHVITASILKRAPRRAPATHAARSLVTFASQTSVQLPAAASVLHSRDLAIISPGGQKITPSHVSVGRNATPSRRSFATYPPELNSYPQYTVFGETCLLGLRVMLPGFKVLGRNTLALDSSKRGRMVLEWTARSADGTLQRMLCDCVFVILAKEEV